MADKDGWLDQVTSRVSGQSSLWLLLVEGIVVDGVLPHLRGDGFDVAVHEQGGAHAGAEVGVGIDTRGALDFVASGDDIAGWHPSSVVDDATDAAIGGGLITVFIDHHHFGGGVIDIGGFEMDGRLAALVEGADAVVF